MKSILILLPALACSLAAADFPVAPDPNVPARLVLDTLTLPEGSIRLPTPFANVTSVHSGKTRLEIEFNPDATKIHLLSPEGAPRPARIHLDTAEDSVQYPDGTVVFSALDASVQGTNAKLESNPGNHRIGFWTKVEDRVTWPFVPTRYGNYRAELTYSLASGVSEISVSLGGTTLEAKLPATGSWYRYRTLDLGLLYLTEEKSAIEVRPASKTGGAVMNLKAITLRPAPEGDPVLQKDAEAITLDSSQATVHGVKLRYEPKPEKSCLGYWTIPTDYASWEIQITAPGTYGIEVTQGCGEGNGGSEVEVIFGEQNLAFTVEETGGFQNWVSRMVGSVTVSEPGPHTLEIRPLGKTHAAVMDIRRVRLVPE